LSKENRGLDFEIEYGLLGFYTKNKIIYGEFWCLFDVVSGRVDLPGC